MKRIGSLLIMAILLGLLVWVVSNGTSGFL